MIYDNNVDLLIHEAILTQDDVQDHPFSLQSVRKETTPPLETPPITIKDIEL